MTALPPSALAALPIFPLPDVVLLPGGLLPLHIFEPRYRAMTEDALAGDRLIAMARALGDGEPHEVPRILGVGHIVAADRLPDGRFRILLRGAGRVRIDEELPLSPRQYRQVRAHALDDEATPPAELLGRHEHLLQLCDRVAALVTDGGEELRELARTQDSPGACADLLAAALVQDPDLRQAMLEELDPAVRLDMMAAHMATLLMQLAPKDETLN
jgi:Lon protease-like protein